jgi:hypothetical protein
MDYRGVGQVWFAEFGRRCLSGVFQKTETGQRERRSQADGSRQGEEVEVSTTYKARSIKRHRRSKSEMQDLRQAIFKAVEAEQPTTIRHVFYCLVSEYGIPKTEAEYKNTVCRLLAVMRREGEIPYEWITDNTRWMMKPKSYASLGDALERCQESYRRNVWLSLPVRVEVWTEKDAISSILYDVTGKWDVPLMTARGYSSLSFLYSTAQDISATGKPTYIYYFGDHDPSGQDARRCVLKTLREFAPDAEIHFEVKAVTVEQIEQYNLPTRPTKKSDSRARGFAGESVEVDALSSHTLRELVDDCITQHIDDDVYQRMRTVEDAERDTLQSILDQLGND